MAEREAYLRLEVIMKWQLYFDSAKMLTFLYKFIAYILPIGSETY